MGTYCAGCPRTPTPCPAGSICAAGVSTPQECLLAHAEWCPNEGMSAALPGCSTSGYILYTYAGQSSCYPCEPGTFAVGPTIERCTSCAPGFYQAQRGQSTCMGCAAGTFAYDARSSGCNDCPTGQFQDRMNQTACRLCPAGTRVAPFAVSQQKTSMQLNCPGCPVGEYTPSEGWDYCVPCPGGAYASDIGQSTCAACPAGKSADAGASTCRTCEAGTFVCPCVDGDRDCLAEHCLDIASGYMPCLGCHLLQTQQSSQSYYCPGDGFVYPRTQAEPGVSYVVKYASPTNYAEDNLLRPCTHSCPEGYYIRTQCMPWSDLLCVKCTPPASSASQLISPCTATSDAQYAVCPAIPSAPGTVCNPCPPGGTLSGSVCVPCPNGTFKASAGNAPCLPCDADMTSEGGASRCTVRCPTDSYAADGLTCTSASGADAYGRRRVVAKAAVISALVAGACFDDGSFLVAQNIGGSGLLWRLAGSMAWLIVGDRKLGPVVALARLSGARFVLAERGCLRTLEWSAFTGAATLSAPLFTTALSDAPIDSIAVLDAQYLVMSLGASVWRVKVLTGLPPLLLFSGDVSTVTPPMVLAFDPDAAALYAVDARARLLLLGVLDRATLLLVPAGGPVNNGLAIARTPGGACGAGGGAGRAALSLDGGLLIASAYLLGTCAIDPAGLRTTRALGGDAVRALWTDSTARRIFAITDADGGAVLELAHASAACLCGAGLYCSEALRQCVPAPVGTYAASWSTRPTPCPAGTLGSAPEGTSRASTCLLCPVGATTYEDGALNCVQRCLFWSHAQQACLPEGCAPQAEFYQDGACIACPQGTLANGVDCVPCASGTYGSAPGVCSACPDQAALPGATACGPPPASVPIRLTGDHVTLNGSDYYNGTAPPASLSVAVDASHLLVGGPQLLAEVLADGATRLTAVVGDTCVSRDGVPFVGVCGAPGDMDGPPASGLARLGHLFGLVAVEVDDGATPIVVLSTLTAVYNCASLRVATLTGGVLSTLVSSDLLRAPAVGVFPECLANAPFWLANARGTDAVYYASHDGRVWLVRTLTPGDASLTPILSIAANSAWSSPVSGLCAIGADDDRRVGLLLTDGTLYQYQVASGEVSHQSVGDGVRQLACAEGGRAWYYSVSNRSLAVVRLASFDACDGGYVWTGGACSQVGLGQFTHMQRMFGAGLFVRTIGLCYPGTFSVRAGSASLVQACTPCPPGLVSMRITSWRCLPCPGGRFAMEGRRCVDVCPVGHYFYYQAGRDAGVSCRACPAGTSTATEGASSIVECTPCPPDTFAKAGDACLPCPIGYTTSPLGGAVHCMPACPIGTCATTPTSDCIPLTNNWEVVTSITLQGGASMRAVAVAAGGLVFFTDGNSLSYFYDDCPAHATLSDANNCARTGANLLPPPSCLVAGCARGFSSLAVAAGPPLVVYATSLTSHAVYAFELVAVFAADGVTALGVDVAATQQRLLGFTADPSSWRLFGGVQGFADGPFASARMDSPSEVELVVDGQPQRLLLISDYGNHRIRVAMLDSATVRTLVGTSTPGWLFGPMPAGVQQPLGLCLGPDGALYVAMNTLSAIGVMADALGGPDAAATTTLAPYCALNYAAAANVGAAETCGVMSGRSCMLNRPFDLVATASGVLFVAVSNGLTLIDTNTHACQQVAGALWRFSSNRGFRDGDVGQSLLNQPFKLALDSARGILYAADFYNVALRRVFVDGQCRCPEGSVYLRDARACYDPLATDASASVICPARQFYSDTDGACLECSAIDIAVYGTPAAVACALWSKVGDGGAFAQGFSFARVVSLPEPLGAIASDWYGELQSGTTTMTYSWDDIIRVDSPFVYRPGYVAGRAPRRGEYVTLTAECNAAHDDVGLVRAWRLETHPLLQPRRLVPGLWAPCTVPYIFDAPGCACSRIPAAFGIDEEEDAAATSMPTRWHALRRAAFEAGGRILGAAGHQTRLAEFARGCRDGACADETRVLLWSRFMLAGSPTVHSSDEAGGPDFPTMVHVQAMEPDDPIDDARTPPVVLQLGENGGSCYVGWPAHYACPGGYMWVGPNTTALGADEVFDPALLPGQIACLSCLPGTFSSSSSSGSSSVGHDHGGPYECIPCDLGSFSSAVGSTGCTLCPSGTYADVLGATACAACPLNHFTTEGAMDSGCCSPCAPGTGSCVDCVEGQYQSHAAMDQCIACPPGTFSNTTNQSTCTPCAPQTFQPLEGMAGCHACHMHTYALAPGATACAACAGECPVVVDGVCGRGCGLNRYWDDQHAVPQCVRCAPGDLNAFARCALGPSACWHPPPGLYYLPSANRSTGDTILECPPGTGANTSRTGCAPCPAGTYAAVAGQGCVSCGLGTFAATSNQTVCAACAPGAEARTRASTACTPCAPGTFSASPGVAGGCAPCPRGTYGADAGLTLCVPCPAGTFGTQFNGSRSALDCQLCAHAEGFYSAAGATTCVYCEGGLVDDDAAACVGCGYGRYEQTSTLSGKRLCLPCPPGHIQPTTHFATNASLCVPCASPFTQVPISEAEGGGQHCTDVPSGFQVLWPFLANSTVAPCPEGTYRNASMRGGCAPCPAGTRSIAGGAAVECPPCLVGTFSFPGFPSCYTCLPGTYAPLPGATACLLCPAGSIADTSSTCTPCPRNTYSASASHPCMPCPFDEVAPGGATACTRCPPWRMRIDDACSPCPAGQYMDSFSPGDVVVGDGAEVLYGCVRCPAGKFNPLPAATSAAACTLCSSGLVPDAAHVACVRCPPGGFVGPGTMRCQPCPVGMWCAATTTNAQPCLPGTYASAPGSTACALCAGGTFMARPIASACVACAAGTFAALGGGATSCTNCASDRFAASAAATACAPRTRQCEAGYYVVVRNGQSTLDNGCAPCQPCPPGQFTVSVFTNEWTKSVSADGACPGNTTAPSYRCLANTWVAGRYLAPQALLLAAGGGEGALVDPANVQSLACNDLSAFPPGFDAVAADAARLMDYTLGPTFECYVGCRFGLNVSAVDAYVRAFPDARGALEAPHDNRFYPAQARLLAARLCAPCPNATCPFNRFRPPPCGPACFLRPSECALPQGGVDGCVGVCDPPPSNAVTVGGALRPDASSCPWACADRFHLTQDGTGCVACSAPCDAGFVHSPVCLPYSRNVCLLCPAIEGGMPDLWVGPNATAGHCAYVCVAGFYLAPGQDALCLPCTFLNNVSCPIGTFRDTGACVAGQVPPPCTPCSTPDDLVGGEGGLRVSFTSAAVGVDNCAATCQVGFHTVDRATGAYIADDNLTTSVWALACTPCRLSDTVTCHGVCPPAHFRDRRVALDTTPGACRACTTHADCAPGEYAPPCSGNGTADVGCLPCPRSRLAGGTRVFVPFAAVGLAPDVVSSTASDGHACPTACAVNHVELGQSRSVGSACVACSEFVASYGGCTESAPTPRPCDFIFAHWNATPAPMWYVPPSYRATGIYELFQFYYYYYYYYYSFDWQRLYLLLFLIVCCFIIARKSYSSPSWPS